jgi:hypothetical protein
VERFLDFSCMHQGAWVYGMHGAHQVFPIRLNPKPKRTMAVFRHALHACMQGELDNVHGVEEQ